MNNNPEFKVALVCGALSTRGGGAPRSIAMQAAAMRTQGIDATIYTGYSRSRPLTLDQYPIDPSAVVASRLIGPNVLGFFPAALARLRRSATEYDVIHLNGAWNLTTFIGSRIAVSRRVPYIVTARGHLGDYDFTRYRMIKPILYHLFEKRNIRDSASMHVCSQWEHDSSLRALGNARVVKIPNVVDLSDFKDPPSRAAARADLGLDDSRFTVISFGRLERVKNPLFLLNAFRLACPSQDSRLFFVGPAEGGAKAEMVAAVKDANMRDRVHFIDFAAGRDRCRWLAAADVFALPSLDDSFSVSAIEAVAAGTHCLLSPYVGAAEYMPETRCAVVPLEIRRWADALRGLHAAPPDQDLPNPDFFNRFSPETVGRQWAETYRSLPGT